jgi:hypothetical protein
MHHLWTDGEAQAIYNELGNRREGVTATCVLNLRIAMCSSDDSNGAAFFPIFGTLLAKVGA